MAKDKKSFIAYSDWYGTFKAIPDEVAGQLIKYIFSYVNDENPKPHENFVINALFEQIKATLKRDLEKWEKQREQRSRAGKRSAELRATKSNERSTSVNETERNSTVNVNDSVNVNVNNINNGFSFRKSLSDLGVEKNLVNDFLKNRKLKRLANTETAFKKIKIEFEKTKIPINELMEKIVFNGWASFKCSWLENEKNIKTNQPKEKTFKRYG